VKKVGGFWFWLLFPIVLLMVVSGVLLLARSAEEGRAIFQEKCISCHTIGGGVRVGPDLEGVTRRRAWDWLLRFILAPDEMLAEGDPIATQLLQEFNNIPMPNMNLSKAEAAAILAYLESLEKEKGKEEGKAPLPLPQPALGKELFTGATRLQNGGPSCIACHSIVGIGALGGGIMGPDLTQAFSNYGDAGITSILADLPFPTMRPLYEDRPLTPEEQAHLKAFLQAAAQQSQQPTQIQVTGQLVVLALLGFLVLMILGQVAWWRRLRGVRRPLVEQAGQQQEEAR